jgi:hypothetical protein
MLDIDDFERVREVIIQEEEQNLMDDDYANKHRVDVTDPNEPSEDAYLASLEGA